MPRSIYDDLKAHLSRTDIEEAAFLFTDPASANTPLRVCEMYAVPAEGFSFHSDYHIELADDVRGIVIRRAWTIGGAIIEAHSHVGGAPAAFSHSDLYGFKEWVPHVRWRLARRPYGALVFASSSFDALLWAADDAYPEPIDSLDVDGMERKMPTSITYKQLSRRRRANR